MNYVSGERMKLLSPEVLGPVLKIGPLLEASVMTTSPGEKWALTKTSDQEAPTLFGLNFIICGHVNVK